MSDKQEVQPLQVAMKRSQVIVRCEVLLSELQAELPVAASISAEKTRRLIDIQKQIVQAYGNSQLSDEDFVIAKQLLRQISNEFRQR